MNEALVIQLATMATIGRVLAIMGISILSGWLLGYAAIKSRVFEGIYIPMIAAMESVPVITFFPVVLVVFVYRIGGYLGTELAADFLVFTAVVWNIWVAQYQAFKTVPVDLYEVSENYDFSFFQKLRYLYIPYSIPKIAANLFPSFADALFYITVSEVFTVGSATFHVFGIGYVLPMLISERAWPLVEVGLASLGAWVVALTLIFRWYARHAVAKYGLDTMLPVRRRGRMSLRQSAQRWNSLTGPMRRLSRYFVSLARVPMPVRPPHERRVWQRLRKGTKYVISGLGGAFLVLLSWEVASFVITIPYSYWLFLVGNLPMILYNIGVDYVRVALIALISLALAVTVGYVLAVRQRIAAFILPVIQAVSAFPAPIYFPVVYIMTFRYIMGLPFGTELYILFLGFVSTFYYVFYSFWMGVQAIPSEFWEIMENYEMSFLTKMRRIILPATFPYLIAGLSSTINSAWGGLMIGEYWPDIYDSHTLEAKYGLMKLLDIWTYSGNIGLAAWSSLVFAIIVVVFSITFTTKLMDLARKRYVVEEGIFAA
ncbi:MAG: ABC transporter permease subunit [Nitrososphaeria archaeon]